MAMGKTKILFEWNKENKKLNIYTRGDIRNIFFQINKMKITKKITIQINKSTVVESYICKKADKYTGLSGLIDDNKRHMGYQL